jgi:IMP cyclohydrolase
MKKISSATLALMAARSGCQKDIEAGRITRDNLTEGAWKNDQYGRDLNRNLKPDDSNFWAKNPSASDDVYRFVADGILKLNNGEHTCFPGDPLKETYLWNLWKDSQALGISYSTAGPTVNYNIISITKDALVLGNDTPAGYFFTSYNR